MPEWPAQNKYIGQPTTRVDAAPKLTGRARYSSDIQANGWLYGMILRSKWPAAKILSVNFDKALSLAGVKAVALARETPFGPPVAPDPGCPRCSRSSAPWAPHR